MVLAQIALDKDVVVSQVKINVLQGKKPKFSMEIVSIFPCQGSGIVFLWFGTPCALTFNRERD